MPAFQFCNDIFATTTQQEASRAKQKARTNFIFPTREQQSLLSEGIECGKKTGLS
jgi:hypothetical protein